jgi:hypothetical protein
MCRKKRISCATKCKIGQLCVQQWLLCICATVTAVYLCKCDCCVFVQQRLLRICATATAAYLCNSDCCVFVQQRLLCICATATAVYLCNSDCCVFVQQRLLRICATATAVYFIQQDKKVEHVFLIYYNRKTVCITVLLCSLYDFQIHHSCQIM